MVANNSLAIDIELTVKPVPPFSFDLSARIFTEGDGRICKYENGEYW